MGGCQTIVWLVYLALGEILGALWFFKHLSHFPSQTDRSEIGDSGQQRAARLRPVKDNGRLFHDQIILYGFNPFDATGYFNRCIDCLLRTNEAAQLNHALVGLDTDPE